MASGADSSEQDRRFMRLALVLARRGLGQVAPNPAVGAVIVDPATTEIIARGWTQPGGRPHAETEALRRAGPRARGATMYVTLEPCSHFGKTPPCADAVVAAGIGRVVAALVDPDPRVAGRGLDRLRAAGIDVTRGVCADQARRITLGHIVRVTERRPFVGLKLALGADGSVPRGVAGRPTFVTGPEARAAGHLMRARADAVLVGAGTVRDDDPELTCRLPGMAARSPIRVVLARRGDVDPASRLVRSARQVPVWLFVGEDAPAAAVARLEALGVRCLSVASVGGELWLPAVCEALAAESITRLLVEGGPAVWAAFARSGLVDEAAVFVAHGGDAAAAGRVLDGAMTGLLGGLPLERIADRPVGDDRLFELRVARRGGRP